MSEVSIPLVERFGPRALGERIFALVAGPDTESQVDALERSITRVDVERQVERRLPDEAFSLVQDAAKEYAVVKSLFKVSERRP